MDQQIVALILVAALVVIVLLAVAWIAMRQRRRQQLREHFGPEYERVVQEEQGDAGRADRVLAERAERVKKLDIRPLPATARDDFLIRWRRVQERFVDDPAGAVADADALIGEAMEARGYPVGDFEQRAADVSVEHPRVVESYRTAHEIASRDGNSISTEDLRQAMVHYRTLFADLVGESPAGDRVEGRVTERIEEREELRR